jgi:hypothetical protein
VLPITINRNENIVITVAGKLECGSERCAITLIFLMGNNVDTLVKCRQSPGGPIARSIVNDKNVRRIARHALKNLFDVIFFVINGQGCEKT